MNNWWTFGSRILCLFRQNYVTNICNVEFVWLQIKPKRRRELNHFCGITAAGSLRWKTWFGFMFIYPCWKEPIESMCDIHGLVSASSKLTGSWKFSTFEASASWGAMHIRNQLDNTAWNAWFWFFSCLNTCFSSHSGVQRRHIFQSSLPVCVLL